MARVKAKEYLEAKPEGDDARQEMRHFYESTFPPENWPVITQERFEQLTKEVQEKILGTDSAEDPFTKGEETVRKIIS
jgi:hypothetical protein